MYLNIIKTQHNNLAVLCRHQLFTGIVPLRRNWTDSKLASNWTD